LRKLRERERKKKQSVLAWNVQMRHLTFCFIAVLFVFIRRAALYHTLHPSSLGYSTMANIIKKDLKLGGDIFWSNS
jgi:hypothetical protein